MELVKNIFFNTDKLVENSNVKISYTGKFFQENAEEVYIHYGFGIIFYCRCCGWCSLPLHHQMVRWQ